MTIIVPRSRLDAALNAVPHLMKQLFRPETGLRAGIRVPFSGRKVVFMDCRMYGRQPNEIIFSHRFGLLKPRSVITIALMRVGMATDSRSSCSTAGSVHLPGLLPGGTTHATGMAHPRQTALATTARSSSDSVVGSMASARSFDFHSDRTHLISGAKAGADVCLIRGRRGAVGAVAEPLAEPLSGGGESAHEGELGGDCGLASALGGDGSERPKGRIPWSAPR